MIFTLTVYIAKLPSTKDTENMLGMAGFQATWDTDTPDTVVFKHTKPKELKETSEIFNF